MVASMTTFKINQLTHPLHGREFPEYTAFRRYNGAVEYVPLLIGANQVKFFALCNLREVEAQPVAEVTQEAIDQLYTELYERHTVRAVDSGLDYIYPQPLAPVQGCALPPYMLDHILALTEILNSRPEERQKSRDLYVYELGYQIADALAA